MHVSSQPELAHNEGPLALVLSPTRELATQIFKEASKYAKPLGLLVVSVFGGMNKHEQFKALKAGCHVVIATPGRMMDMIAMKACSTSRITFFVLDEADRMFYMGFGKQIQSIMDQLRPDRQTLMFSATFKQRVEKLARHQLQLPVRITIGSPNAANADVTQHAVLLTNPAEKWAWCAEHLGELMRHGQLLVFVATKLAAEELTRSLQQHSGFSVQAIHGDKHQAERSVVVDKFKAHHLQILIATDVAARGLDIKGLKTVLCYDAPRDAETHTHRVGRTGRAGEEGTAYALVLSSESKYAGVLVDSLDSVDQPVSPPLLTLALKDKGWKRSAPPEANEVDGFAGSSNIQPFPGAGRGRGTANDVYGAYAGDVGTSTGNHGMTMNSARAQLMGIDPTRAAAMGVHVVTPGVVSAPQPTHSYAASSADGQMPWADADNPSQGRGRGRGRGRGGGGDHNVGYGGGVAIPPPPTLLAAPVSTGRPKYHNLSDPSANMAGSMGGGTVPDMAAIQANLQAVLAKINKQVSLSI